jgi:hypothetical protein
LRAKHYRLRVHKLWPIDIELLTYAAITPDARLWTLDTDGGFDILIAVVNIATELISLLSAYNALTPDNNRPRSNRHAATGNRPTGHSSWHAVNHHGGRASRNHSRVRRMLWFGMRCQWISHPGDGFAIYKHIGGAGKHRRGREALVVGA